LLVALKTNSLKSEGVLIFETFCDFYTISLCTSVIQRALGYRMLRLYVCVYGIVTLFL